MLLKGFKITLGIAAGLAVAACSPSPGPPAPGHNSCLEPTGKPRIAKELSEDDVRKIEALIREVDSIPLINIERLGPGQEVYIGEYADGDFAAATGGGCGSLSGNGNFYRVFREDGEWKIEKRGGWIA